jgi:hypothetical protein
MHPIYTLQRLIPRTGGEMKDLLDQVERFWCTAMHSNVMWPVHNQYRCGVCLRAYPVPFAAPAHRGR